MKVLSEQSYQRLASYGTDLDLLKERHERLALEYRRLERKYQEMLLLLGMKGLRLEVKPAIPAQPERQTLRRIK